MTKFQVGDKVRLTEEEIEDLKRDDSWARQAGFTADGIYTVSAANLGMVNIEGKAHPTNTWGAAPWDGRRFVKVEEEEQMTFQVGDRVRCVRYPDASLQAGDMGTVTRLTGTSYPYLVKFDDNNLAGPNGHYVMAEEIESATEEAAQRPDYTALIDEADKKIEACLTVGIGGEITGLIQRLRDALVEESYRV